MIPLSPAFLWSMSLQVVLLPLAVTLVLLRLGRRMESWMPFDAWAVAAGFLAAYFVVYTQFSFPPLQALDWLAVLLPALLFITIFRDILPYQSIRALPALLVFAALVVLLWPLLQHHGHGKFFFEAAVAAIVWWGVWHYLDREFHDDTAVALAIIIVAAGNAIIAAETGSILTGQLYSVLAACMGGWMLWRIWRPYPVLEHGVIAVAVLTLGSLMVVGRFYADIAAPPTLLSLAGLAVVPLFQILGRRRRRYVALFLASFAALIPVAFSIFLALRGHAGAMRAY